MLAKEKCQFFLLYGQGSSKPNTRYFVADLAERRILCLGAADWRHRPRTVDSEDLVKTNASRGTVLINASSLSCGDINDSTRAADLPCPSVRLQSSNHRGSPVCFIFWFLLNIGYVGYRFPFPLSNSTQIFYVV
jgi:hypothetical protein